MFGFDAQRTRYNPNETALNTSNVSGLMLDWSYTTGSYIYSSSPTVVNGIVYFGSWDKNVYALDANTGTLKWSYTTGHFVYSSPSVVNGIVYVASLDHNLYALDANTGTLKWSYATAGMIEFSSPTVVNGLVYVGSDDGKLYALDATLGTLKWSYTTGSSITSSSPAVANGIVYISSDDNNLYALDANTGTLIWSYTTGGSLSPTVSNGVVYVESNGGILYALDAATGILVWNSTIGNVSSASLSIAVANGVIYVTSGYPDNKLYALDANTGMVKWSSATIGLFQYSSPAIAGGVVYIGSENYYLYALDANTGTVLWSYLTGFSVLSSPAVVNGMVYVGSDDYKLYAFHLPSTRPFNSLINNLTTDATTTQSETSVAVSSVNSPGLTVMVGYNDDNPISAGYTGYSYSFDGGTSWTDAGALPIYKDSTGLLGYNAGDPALTVDNNGTFYFAQVAFTYQHAEFISMSTCRYSSTTKKIVCSRPKRVSGFVDYISHANDKPGIAYDSVNNRVYVTWTEFVYNTSHQQVKAIPKLRYYNISTNSFSTTYSLSSFPNGNGTAPIVTSSGLVYVFFLQQTTPGLGKAIVYFTFNNGTITSHTLANILPAANIVPACASPDPQEAFITEAFDTSHAARTNEFPAVAIDSSSNIDVVWEAASSSNGGISTIFVATLPSGGGTPTIQTLPNPNNLIQWQPAIAFAGGTNALAVTYYQVVNTPSGYQIERDQVNAPASSQPIFSSAFPISTVSWQADLTNPNFDKNFGSCYMGDYSTSVSTSTANVVWSYWGDNRNGQPDVYGLFISIP